MTKKSIPRVMIAILLILAGCGGNGGGNPDAIDGAGDTPADHAEQTGDLTDVPSEQVEGTGDPSDVPAEPDLDADDNLDGPKPCDNDGDCTSGEEWCEGGFCVPCDNSGLACDIMCTDGWSTYSRNGCSPCECAPVNDCTADGDCTSSGSDPMKCYAGAFCWDWCPEGDPSCCFGNICSPAGCTEPPPTGCFTRGCPEGQSCEHTGCAPSGCGCSGGSWACDADCGGGTCRPAG
jgi:hypothetical protein